MCPYDVSHRALTGPHSPLNDCFLPRVIKVWSKLDAHLSAGKGAARAESPGAGHCVTQTSPPSFVRFSLCIHLVLYMYNCLCIISKGSIFADPIMSRPCNFLLLVKRRVSISPFIM
jgi:hypothetical protein